MSKLKIRATLQDISGKERYELIFAAMSQYNTAIGHNFFLEATALIESLICDRLESTLGELTKAPVNFDTIGYLLKKLRPLEKDINLKGIMNKELNVWCGERNKVIHEAAKIQLNNKKDWATFLKLAEKTAKDGRKIFDEYNKQLQKLRKNSN